MVARLVAGYPCTCASIHLRRQPQQHLVLPALALPLPRSCRRRPTPLSPPPSPLSLSYALSSRQRRYGSSGGATNAGPVPDRGVKRGALESGDRWRRPMPEGGELRRRLPDRGVKRGAPEGGERWPEARDEIKKRAATLKDGLRDSDITADTEELIGSRGRILSVRSEAIGVDRLGRPVEAVILRDTGRIHHRAQVRLRDARSLRDDSPSAVIGAVEADVLQVTDDVVRRNIDELRPGRDVVRSWMFDRLAKQLELGFTSSQLAMYLEHNRSQSKQDALESRALEDTAERQDTRPKPWIIKLLPWVQDPPPSASMTDGRTDPLLRGYTHGGMTSKERLATRLLRECWNLKKDELIFPTGRLEVELGESEYSLLEGWGDQIKREIKRDYLRRHYHHVKLLPGRRAVSIVASRPEADAALRFINRLLGSMTTRRLRLADTHRSGGKNSGDNDSSSSSNGDGIIDAGWLDGRLLGPDVLRVLARATGTYLQLDKTGSHFGISWIATADEKDSSGDRANLEDKSATVFGLLLAAFGPTPRRETRHLPFDSRPPAVAACRFVDQEGAAVERLPWTAQHARPWRRWVRDKDNRQEDEEDKANMESGRSWTVRPADVFLWDLRSRRPAATADHWSAEPTVTTTALFGQVLHSSQSDELPRASMDRVLLPATPRLDSVSELLQPDEEAKQSPGLPLHRPNPRLVLRFLPAPAHRLAGSAPRLELTIYYQAPSGATPLKALVDEAVLQLQDLEGMPGGGPRSRAAPRMAMVSLRAVVDSHVSDILHPGRPVDCRVTQTRAYTLPYATMRQAPSHGYGHIAESLAGFLSRFRVDLADRYGGYFDTAARVETVRLPKRLLLQDDPPSSPAGIPSGRPPFALTDTAATGAAAAPATAGRDASGRPGAGATDDSTVAVDYVFAGLEHQRAIATPFGYGTTAFTNIRTSHGGDTWLEMSLEPTHTGTSDRRPLAPNTRRPALTYPGTEAANFLRAVEKIAQSKELRWNLPKAEREQRGTGEKEGENGEEGTA